MNVDENRYYEMIRDYKNKIHSYQQYIQDLERENERLAFIKECLSRQVKERANVEKNNRPKKEHTGYMLVLSNPVDYRYYHHGDRKRITLFETIIQSPYNLDYSYEEAKALIYDDISRNNENDENMLNLLGAEHCYSEKKYEELIDKEINSIQTEWFNERVKEYTQEHKWKPSWDEECKLRTASTKIELHLFFDFNIRMNGKDGRWELIFFHTEPLVKVPNNMRFKKAQIKQNDK